MEYLQLGFDKKFIFCGDYCYLKEYTKPFLLGCKRSNEAVKSNDNESSKVKRYDNLKRTRDMVAKMVYTNLTEYTKFLTLTSSETILDVKPFDRKMTTFFQQMRRKGYDLKYIYVYERQKERGKKENNIGCIHAHCIIFNEEYIDMDILKKCWKHGRVELKILNGLRCENNKETEELIRNPASYLCKYITKESVAEWNEKVYRCSKNIKRPVEINNEIYINQNSVGVTEWSDDILQHFQETYVAFYSNSKTIKCNTEQGKLNYIISTTVGRMEK